jgi:photosystem II stability/assembly factor-like uncharacterized protein
MSDLHQKLPSYKIDLADVSLFGNDAADLEQDAVFLSYAVERTEISAFLDRNQAIQVIGDYRGEGKSALVRLLRHHLQSTGLVLGISAIGPDHSPAVDRVDSDVWTRKWKKALLRLVANERERTVAEVTAKPGAGRRAMASGLASLALLASVLMLQACSVAVRELPPDVRQGGRVVSIARPVQRPQEWLVASESGGLFRTVDGGASFTWIAGLPSFQMADVAYAPHDPDVILVTFREDFDFRIGANSGVIWRSTDGGRSWDEPPSAALITNARCPERKGAYGISFQAGTQNVVVGTMCGLAISTDLGAHWTIELPDPASPVGSYQTQDRLSSVWIAPDGRVVSTGDSGIWVRYPGPHPRQRWVRSHNEGLGQWGTIHGITASSTNAAHVFVVGTNPLVLESIDQGETWTAFATDYTAGMREPFVRASAPTGADTFDLYVGNGTGVHRHHIAESMPLAAAAGVQPDEDLVLAHADPSDVLFDVDYLTPLLIAGDGGLQRQSVMLPIVPLDSGHVLVPVSTWTLCCASAKGLHALQIQDVIGQTVSSGDLTQLHLYFAAQDNSLHASGDRGVSWTGEYCCEGGALQIEPQVASIEDTHLTGVGCGSCANFLSTALLGSVAPWPNAATVDGFAGLVDEGPLVRLDGGWYLQNAQDTSALPAARLRLTKDYGATWEPGIAIDIAEVPSSYPLVVRENGQYTLLQALQRPGVGWAPMAAVYGLMKIQFPSGSVARIDDTLQALEIARFGQFQSRPLLAADANDSSNLLAVDLDAMTVRYSVDGGAWWFPDAVLTSLVQQNGRYAFRSDIGFARTSIISALAFDPYNSCHMLAGAHQGGIYRSQDGGASWHHIDGSEQIPNISAFFFPATGPIWVGSFGRGLWSMDVDRGVRGCPAHRARPTSAPATIAQHVIIDPVTGDPMPPAGGGPPLPRGCAGCELIVAHEGAIDGAELDGERVRRFALAQGNAFQFSAHGEEMSLSIPNVRPPELARDRVPAIFERLNRRGDRVRAMIVRDGRLVGLVTGAAVTDFTPRRVPRVRALPPASNREGLRVIASGFAPHALVRIEVRDARSILTEGSVGADEHGVVRAALPATRGAVGLRSVALLQRDGVRTLAAAAQFMAAPPDERD